MDSLLTCYEDGRCSNSAVGKGNVVSSRVNGGRNKKEIKMIMALSSFSK